MRKQCQNVATIKTLVYLLLFCYRKSLFYLIAFLRRSKIKLKCKKETTHFKLCLNFELGGKSKELSTCVHLWCTVDRILNLSAWLFTHHSPYSTINYITHKLNILGKFKLTFIENYVYLAFLSVKRFFSPFRKLNFRSL